MPLTAFHRARGANAVRQLPRLLVLLDGSTGYVAVTVAGRATTPLDSFTVLGPPLVTAVAPKFASAGTMMSVSLTGDALVGSVYTLVPANGGGTGVELGVDTETRAAASLTGLPPALGTYVVVATNPFGQSTTTPSIDNQIVVYNPTLDADGDGVADAIDSCPTLGNPHQYDADADGVGDACETDLRPVSASWVAWDAAPAAGVASGVVHSPSGDIQVTYSGEVYVGQASSGTFYWDCNGYSGPTVAAGPDTNDIIGLTGGSSTEVNRLTFAPALEHAVMAIVSLGQSSAPRTYVMDQEFEVIAQGAGHWNGGQLTTSDGYTVQGSEGNGVIRFLQPLTELSWTVPVSENWHAFTVGALNSRNARAEPDAGLEPIIGTGPDANPGVDGSAVGSDASAVQ